MVVGGWERQQLQGCTLQVLKARALDLRDSGMGQGEQMPSSQDGLIEWILRNQDSGNPVIARTRFVDEGGWYCAILWAVHSDRKLLRKAPPKRGSFSSHPYGP